MHTTLTRPTAWSCHHISQGIPVASPWDAHLVPPNQPTLASVSSFDILAERILYACRTWLLFLWVSPPFLGDESVDSDWEDEDGEGLVLGYGLRLVDLP